MFSIHSLAKMIGDIAKSKLSPVDFPDELLGMFVKLRRKIKQMEERLAHDESRIKVMQGYQDH
jgi:hypothetical protein